VSLDIMGRMKEYFSLDKQKREHIEEIIKKTLYQRGDIVFAYLYGSFLDSPSFRDIDIGVHIRAADKNRTLDYEMEVAQSVSEATGMPFDIVEITVLNFAPNSFLNNVFSRGTLLFSKNNQLLADIIEDTSLDALANEHIASQSLRELIPT